MNPTSLNRSLNLLYPPFRERIEKGLARAREEKLMAYVFEAWRSRERQAFLYAQGRSTPGAIVTNAKAGTSLHEFGLSVDLVFDSDPVTPGIQWSWSGDYKRLAAILLEQKNIETLRMEQAHFQMSLGMKITDIQRIVEARGLLALWSEFDKILAL